MPFITATHLERLKVARERQSIGDLLVFQVVEEFLSFVVDASVRGQIDEPRCDGAFVDVVFQVLNCAKEAETTVAWRRIFEDPQF